MPTGVFPEPNISWVGGWVTVAGVVTAKHLLLEHGSAGR
eukprot:SAG22_NODE_1293_length_4847_cov_1.996841_4_plen_39_part_00